jgi:plasmid stabilization system protein ParE
MPFEIILSTTANKELESAVDWYNERLDGLGLHLIEAVDKRLSLLSETPDMFPVRESGFNEILIEKFPYLIVYKILKKRHRVRILHIFHSSRNPDFKK